MMAARGPLVPSPSGTSTAPDQASSHTLKLPGGQTISALLSQAPDSFACLVLAHGAGAGMRHAFMAAVADGLARRGVSVLRYQFRYMEAGSKRPDPPTLAHAAVRAAVATAADLVGPLPLFAGGKSFGARMTSQAQSAEPLAWGSRPDLLRVSAAPGWQAIDRPGASPR